MPKTKGCNRGNSFCSPSILLYLHSHFGNPVSELYLHSEETHRVWRSYLLKRWPEATGNPLWVSFHSFVKTLTKFSSVQFSSSVVSDSLRPHGLQHARPPCPSPTPGVYPNPCPLSQWCHPTISSSVVPFSSCPQSFPASGSFQMSQLFTSGGQSIGVSASLKLPSSVLPRTQRKLSTNMNYYYNSQKYSRNEPKYFSSDLR